MKSIGHFILKFVCIFLIFSINQNIFACTDFRLKANDKSILITRSMEYAEDMRSNIRTSPRGKAFSNKTPDGKDALAWKSKYGYVYADALDVPFALDGLNEKGLSFEYLYLPGETQYQSIPEGKNANAVPYFAFGDWVLGNFTSVDEVKAALKNLIVYSATVSGFGDMVFPVHASIFDASGKGIVVEFVAGKMNVFDNDVGVFTNSPTYDWHVVNLRNYVNLSPYTPNPVKVGGMTFIATGQGSGMRGLPGDISPPSRFVKTALLVATSFPPKDSADALNIAQHIINNVDITKGTVRAKDSGNDLIEYTQWVLFKDLTNKMFHFRTYNDLTIRSISLDKLDFSENAAELKMPMSGKPMSFDITDQFQQTNGAKK